MKKMILLLFMLSITFMLASCSMFSGEQELFDKYCEEFTSDLGCQTSGEPTGINVNDNNVDDVTVVCELGYHVENNLCVVDQEDPVCSGENILYNGSCVSTCELPIDDPNYYPCFRDIAEEFDTTKHKLELTSENGYFGSFTMWVQSTSMNNSSEFELHHTLKGETEVIVSRGGVRLWCTPHMLGCENLNKAFYSITNTTGEFNYEFSFWYDEDWYVRVLEVTYDVWNTETNEYDIVNLGITEFYLEDIS